MHLHMKHNYTPAYPTSCIQRRLYMMKKDFHHQITLQIKHPFTRLYIFQWIFLQICKMTYIDHSKCIWIWKYHCTLACAAYDINMHLKQLSYRHTLCHVVEPLSHCDVDPSSLHTTLASLWSHESLHTVPHTPTKHTSTRPASSEVTLPSIRRTSPVPQEGSGTVVL